MRARSRRILLLAFLLAVPIAGGGLYIRRERARDADARQARETGLAAFAQRDYPIAVLKLGEFIRRLDPDALALLRYGQAIRRLHGQLDTRHLESAIVSLRRSAAKEPDGAEARRELLELYQRVGFRTEAIEQANWFLSKDPGDEEALKVKATAVAATNQPAEALAVLRDRVGTDAPRLELQLLYVGLMANAKLPPAEILKRAEEVEAANSSDRRFRLVGARARLLTGDIAGAQVVLMSLVEVAAGDKLFARLLVPSLDAAMLSRQSLEVLLTFDGKDLDPEMQVDLVKRLWESGDVAAIEQRVSSWKLESSALPTGVLGYEVMALCRLKKVQDARLLLGNLQARRDDVRAMGWVRLLDGVFLVDHPPVNARIAACLGAIESDAGNAQSRFELGLAYREAGEAELAIRELLKAGAIAANWPEPAVLGARILAENGQLPAAVSAAMVAELRGSEDPGVGLLTTMARIAGDNRDGRTLPDRLLDGMKKAGRPARETLPIRLALAASSGRTSEEKSLVEEVLQSADKPEGEILLACLLLSQKHGLGLDASCVARYEELYGSTPALALALARQAATAEGAPGGRALLQSRRAAATDKGSSAWLAAEAAFLEAFGTQDEALQAWRETAKAAKEEPRRLRAILDAASTWRDRDFARTTIDELRSATGQSCLWWRYYEARWTLSAAKVDSGASGAAITQLREILDLAPELAPARLLLAGAYEGRGEWQKALDQLTVVKGAGRSTVSLELAIVRLQLRVGNWTAARDQLERLAKEDTPVSRMLTAEQRLAMAGMFARLGDPKSVLELLDKLGTVPASSDEIQGRAELYANAGELDLAQRMIGPEAAKGESPQALLLAAALAEYQGRTKDAESILVRLDSLVEDPLRRQRMIADHFLRVQNTARAEAVLRQIIALEGADGADWSRLLAILVLQGSQDPVRDALEQGRSRGWFSMRDGNDALSPEVLRLAVARAPLRPLGAAYVRESSQRAAAEQAIRFLDASEREEPSPTERSRFRSLVDGNAKFLELQLAWADFLFRRREFDDAILVCKTAASSFPASPEPLRAMAYCYRAMGLSGPAADAVKGWRSRSAGLTLQADVFLAEQSTPAEAAALLSPHLERALERGILEVLVLYGHALILQDQADRLSEVLAPHLARTRAVVEAWIECAGFLARRGDASRAASWLGREEVRAAAEREPEIRLPLATAWQFIAAATGSQEAREKSRAFLRELPQEEGLPAKAWERIGQLHEALDEVEHAEQAYLRALALEANTLVAANNLAMILARSARAKDAQPLADRLVLRRPDVAEYGDTRAFVYVQLGDLDTAIKQYEECRRLEPKKVEWALQIVELTLARGDRDAAAKRLQSFQAGYPKDGVSPAQGARWTELERKLGLPPGPGR